MRFSLSSLVKAPLPAQLVKNPSAARETWFWSLGWEDPLEKGTATHASILAWRIPRTVYAMGSQRVGHNFCRLLHVQSQQKPSSSPQVLDSGGWGAWLPAPSSWASWRRLIGTPEGFSGGERVVRMWGRVDHYGVRAYHGCMRPRWEAEGLPWGFCG